MIGDMKGRGTHRAGETGPHAVRDEDAAPDMDERYTGTHRDDISGQVLRDDLVDEARQKELGYFCDKGGLDQTAQERGPTENWKGPDSSSMRGHQQGRRPQPRLPQQVGRQGDQHWKASGLVRRNTTP